MIIILYQVYENTNNFRYRVYYFSYLLFSGIIVIVQHNISVNVS